MTSTRPLRSLAPLAAAVGLVAVGLLGHDWRPPATTVTKAQRPPRLTTGFAPRRETPPLRPPQPPARQAGPAFLADRTRPAGPAYVTDLPSEAQRPSAISFAVSKPAGPLARPLPLFTDTTAVVVPAEGLVVGAPPTTVPPTTVPPTTTRAPKRAKATPTTVTVAPNTAAPTAAAPPSSAPPVVVPPSGLVIPAPGTPTIPTTLAPTPTMTTMTTVAPTPTTVGVVPLPVSTTPSTAASTVAPTTAEVTTRPATTAPRVGVGPRPTIMVRPVTEGRDAPALPSGETPLPTVAPSAPSNAEPKTYTFVGATGPAPARHPQADAAVAEALGHVGTPYIWGGEGPDGFDCSGLSLVAWRAAGVALPHQSRSQFAQTVRINVADLAPGDLLFFGDPIHHLGIYLGDGKMVEAAKPGTNVRTSTIKRRDLVGIGRITA